MLVTQLAVLLVEGEHREQLVRGRVGPVPAEVQTMWIQALAQIQQSRVVAAHD